MIVRLHSQIVHFSLFQMKELPAIADHPRAVVLIVHGFSWHSAYFEPLAVPLSALGVDVVAFDLQGHGESAGEPRGYMDRFQVSNPQNQQGHACMRTTLIGVALLAVRRMR